MGNGFAFAGETSHMGLRFSRVARIACLLALSSTSIAATTAATAYQDFADYSGIALGAEGRWRAHLVEVPVSSSYGKVENASSVSPAILNYGLALRASGDLDMLRGDTSAPLPTVTLKGDRPFKPAVAPAALAVRLALLDPALAGIAADARSFEMTAQTPTAAEEAIEVASAKTPTAPVAAPKKPKAPAAHKHNAQDEAVRGTLSAYAPTGTDDANDPFGAVLTPPVVVPPSALPRIGAAETFGRPSGRPSYEPHAEAAKAAKKSLKARIVLNPGGHKWALRPLPASQFSRKARKCLAEGIYFEARGESKHGQKAVAQVIVNRVKNPTFPNSICGVVYHNKHMRNRCQFSFACDGIRDRVRSKKAWHVAKRIADDVIDGKVWLKEVGSSSHYHADYVRPRWARAMKKMSKIGKHIFFRTKDGGWG